ncbi:hypothetical protein DM01DRAFT_1392157 [Hesseltinella vesiculosa]|uniref:Uncharacterized protein n=1 Tax=Hesseltinella vesiculosa TaxID=101127 RepID=A0A1X2GVI6_9FUNG|nr:hypothetical protein DM01DRAFT_1392157 [Hesseltinella vesiculosa]
MNIDDNAITRRNPRHCRGCRFPCQQVVLNSRLIGSGEMTLQDWWEALLLVVPPITGLAHVRQAGDYLSVHFFSPQSAHSFITNPARWHTLMSMREGVDTIISPARVDGRMVQYHSEPHHLQTCHLAQNRHLRRRRQSQANPPPWDHPIRRLRQPYRRRRRQPYRRHRRN